MKKGLIIIRNVIVGIIFVLYLGVIIGVSTLILTRNDYGVTQFDEKVLIIIDKTNANDRYKDGQLVVVESRKFEDLKIGQEVFVYQTNMQENTVTIVSSSIKEINNAEKNKHIVLQTDGTAWGEEFIAGEAISVHDDVGKVLQFLQSKWIFFIIFIVPLFFVLLYLIYKIVVVIKFESDDLTEEEMALLAQKDEPVKENETAASDDKIAALMNEIAALKEKIDSTEEQKAAVSDNPTEVDKPEEIANSVEKVDNTLPVVENVIPTQAVEVPKVETTSSDYVDVPVMISTEINEDSIVEKEKENNDAILQNEENIIVQDMKPIIVDSISNNEMSNEEKNSVNLESQVQKSDDELL